MFAGMAGQKYKFVAGSNYTLQYFSSKEIAKARA